MNSRTLSLARDDWAPDVKQALNRFVELNRGRSAGERPYVVFDSDNTASIFDIGEQLLIYQLQRMAFALTPEQLTEAIRSELHDFDLPLVKSGYPQTTYSDWLADITAAYSLLYAQYGPFRPEGLSVEVSAAVQQEDAWKEFATKLRAFYDVIFDSESNETAFRWMTYWTAGMTPDEACRLSYDSHAWYSTVESAWVTWHSPEGYPSRVGPVSFTWLCGVQVTANIRELMSVLAAAGIDIWVCSAADVEVVRAGVDFWQLHDYVTGVMGLTCRTENGLRLSRYDENGHGYLTDGPGWREDTQPIRAMTHAAGKVAAIQNVLCRRYGCGPAAGFMDSEGDFNFCTEFRSLQLVVCFNRADRKVTDGGGLIAELAVYQRDDLHYDLDRARAAGDTLYVLQGREENGLRCLRGSSCTVVLGEREERLFANEDNYTQLDYIRQHAMTTGEILNTFCIKTAAGAAENRLGGVEYGFLTEYAGYHSIG